MKVGLRCERLLMLSDGVKEAGAHSLVEIYEQSNLLFFLAPAILVFLCVTFQLHFLN